VKEKTLSATQAERSQGQEKEGRHHLEGMMLDTEMRCLLSSTSKEDDYEREEAKSREDRRREDKSLLRSDEKDETEYKRDLTQI
jgi:hypothetical protein